MVETSISAPRVRSAGRPGSGRRLGYGESQSHEQDVRDHYFFTVTVRNGKVTNIREYIDPLALARASEMAAST
jgi:hypothetical protein